MRLPFTRRDPAGGTPAHGAGPADGADSAAPLVAPIDGARAIAAGAERVRRRQRSAERRGTVAALVVSVVIGVLIVTLQPDPKPPRPVEAAPAPSTVVTTTTIAPGVQLCMLAQQFVKDAEGLSPTDTARIAEAFFAKAVKLVDPVLRADFDALLRYYTEFNAIGTEFDYDLDRIAKAGRADRWAQLLYRSPAGLEAAERTLREQCDVVMPAPPTVITLPPTSFTLRRSEGE